MVSIYQIETNLIDVLKNLIFKEINLSRNGVNNRNKPYYIYEQFINENK